MVCLIKVKFKKVFIDIQEVCKRKSSLTSLLMKKIIIFYYIIKLKYQGEK